MAAFFTLPIGVTIEVSAEVCPGSKRLSRKLREHMEKYEVCLRDYCVTCNYPHLLMGRERLEASRYMQEVASEFAREYNPRSDQLHQSAQGGDPLRLRLKRTPIWK